MHRPTWVTIVGVIGIVLAAFGILGSAQWLFMPLMLDFQKNMLSEMSSGAAGSGADQAPVEMFEFMQKMLDMPTWYPTWSVVAGVISLFVVGFYFFAAIHLLQMKPSALKIFYSAVTAWIALAILKVVVAFLSSPLLGFGSLSGALAGTVVNAVLLVVIITGDKACFVDRQAEGAN